MLDLAGGAGRRIVATGGGVHSPAWLQALADGTGLPVDVVDVPEGAALGAAYLAASHRRPRARHVGCRPVGPHRAEGRTGAVVAGRCGRALRALPRARRSATMTDLLPDPPAAEVAFTVISVDDHLVEPRHVFEGRVAGAARAIGRRT